MTAYTPKEEPKLSVAIYNISDYSMEVLYDVLCENYTFLPFLLAGFSAIYCSIRKIIFWLDRDKKFINTIDEIELIGVRKHKLNDNNYFFTKYLLEEEDTISNFLIYTNENLKDDIDN